MFCKNNSEEPDKPFSGKFNLRLDPETHKNAVIAARKMGFSLNSWIINVVQKSLGDDNHI